MREGGCCGASASICAESNEESKAGLSRLRWSRAMRRARLD